MRELGNDLPLMGNSHEVTAHHFILDLDIDMDQKVIHGIITLFLKPSYRQIRGMDFVVKKDEDSSFQTHKHEKLSSNKQRNKDIIKKDEESSFQTHKHKKLSSNKQRNKDVIKKDEESSSHTHTHEQLNSDGVRNKDGSSGCETLACDGSSTFSARPKPETNTSEKNSVTKSDAHMYKDEKLSSNKQRNKDGSRLSGCESATSDGSSTFSAKPSPKTNTQSEENSATKSDAWTEEVEDSRRGYCVPELDPLFEEDSRRGYCVPELDPLFEEDSRRGYCVPELDPLFEEDSRRGYCVPELDPTASRKEAKEVFATLMSVHNCPPGRPLHHRVDPWCLRVWREGVRDRESFPRVVRIKYRTTPGGGSLTWVTDQDGKPCVFTQGSCINNRSLFPCHDFLTMATWQAVVHSPHGTTVLMSGGEPGAPCQPDAIAKQPDEGTLMSGEEPGVPWQLDAVAKQPDEGTLVAKQTEPGSQWQPEDATWQPDAVAKQPDAVAKQPDAVAKQPDEETLIAKQTGPGSQWQPEDATWQPDAVAKQPDAVARQPDAVTKQPDAVAKQPVSVAKQPDAVAKQPDAVTTQPDAVAKQPDAVTKQPDEETLVTKQTNSAQEVQFASMDLPLANELTSFRDHEQMHEGVASVAKQFDVAKQPADTGACSEVAARDHHYFYVTMPMPCSTLALAVGYWLQAYSEGSTTQKHNHRLQPSVHSGNAQETVDHPQPNQGENYCEVAPQKQFDADDTSQHEESINPPTCTLPSVQVTVEPVEQHVDHSGMDHQAGREFLPLIEKYLAAAYDVLGPHPLPRLDVLVVPRCFASLGLASPHLMLVSQSLLAGDGSMCLRLAHEIAHSWFGLLIGSRDWTEEWISEGFATYLEDCIHAKAMGWTEKDHEEYSGLRAAIRYRLLAAELENTEIDLC
ncbi:metalloaminopeptidase [Branchiostoma belcheri]|nr:metalloaminopeptidase [Branchiostoma belcheri]